MKRLLASILVPLALGLLTTIAVAWGCLAISGLKPAGSTTAAWTAAVPPSWGNGASTTWQAGRGVSIAEQWADDWTPGTANLAALLAGTPTPREGNRALRIDCGWPFLALRSSQRGVFDSASKLVNVIEPLPLYRAGLPVKWKQLPAGPFPRARLPIAPIWPGFAISVLVYAALFVAIPQARRGLLYLYRRRCSLCTTCGYPAGPTTTCTECGGRIRPFSPPRDLPRGVTPLQRTLTTLSIIAVALSLAAYAASGLLSIYLKAPAGWYLAIWRGRIALGRSSTPFESLLPEFRRIARSFTLPDTEGLTLLGGRVSAPLALPLLLLLVITAAACWRLAVRRGLAKHWPKGL